MRKWRPKERAMAPSKKGLIHGFMTKRDWFSDSEFKALHISMVTRIERAMVMGSGAWKKMSALCNNCLLNVRELCWLFKR